jgi:hypothetical protein
MEKCDEPGKSTPAFGWMRWASGPRTVVTTDQLFWHRASVSMTYRPDESVQDDGVQRLTRTARDRHFAPAVYSPPSMVAVADHPGPLHVPGQGNQ